MTNLYKIFCMLDRLRQQKLRLSPRMHIFNMCHEIPLRENREGWPLLIVEYETNGDSKSTNERDPSFVGSLDSFCRCKKIYVQPWCCSRPSTKYFFPHRIIFQLICPHRPASWAGSRAGSPVSQCASVIPFIEVCLYEDLKMNNERQQRRKTIR